MKPMSNFVKSLLVLTLTTFTLVACNRDRVAKKEMAPVNPIDAEAFQAIKKSIEPYQSQVSKPSATTACESLESLTNEAHAESPTFQFLTEFDLQLTNKGPQFLGGTEISHSPIAQKYLGEDALSTIHKSFSNEDLNKKLEAKKQEIRTYLTQSQEGVKKAQEAYQTYEELLNYGPPTYEIVNKLSETKKQYTIAQQKQAALQEKLNPQLDLIQSLQTALQDCQQNSQSELCLVIDQTKWKESLPRLEAQFPGLLGRSSNLLASPDAPSFPLALILKTVRKPLDKITPDDLKRVANSKKILETPTPIFSALSWQEFSQKELSRLSSAKDSLLSTDLRERLCGLVLWQRSLSQLLVIKGFQKPLTEKQTDGGAYLNQVSQKYAPQNQVGSFVENQQRVVVSDQALAQYNPTSKIGALLLSSTTSLQDKDVNSQASLSDTIAFLSYLTQILEVTHPSMSWVQKTGFVGDIQKSKAAILNDKIRSLALGFMNVTLKNIKLGNIKPLDSQGKEFKPDGKSKSPSSVLLGEASAQKESSYIVKLSQLADFVKVSAQLQALALRPLPSESPLDENVRNGIEQVKSNLNALNLPLLLTMQKMMKSHLCAYEQNLTTGLATPLEKCAQPETLLRAKSALQDLSKAVKTPLPL